MECMQRIGMLTASTVCSSSDFTKFTLPCMIRQNKSLDTQTRVSKQQYDTRIKSKA